MAAEPASSCQPQVSTVNVVLIGKNICACKLEPLPIVCPEMLGTAIVKLNLCQDVVAEIPEPATVTNYVETLYAPAAGSAFTISLANGTIQEISLNANGTLTLPSSVAGKSFTIIVTYSGAYSLTWAGGGTLKWAGGTTPTATSVSGKYDIFNFYQDGTNTYGSVYGLNY